MKQHWLPATVLVASLAAGTEAAPDPSFDKAVATPVAALRKSAAAMAPVKGVEVFPASHRQQRGRHSSRDWDQGRPRRGSDRDWDRPGWGTPRRGEACHAFDRGWEEHWGGHGGNGYSPAQACGRCKKPSGPHGDCRFRCTVEATRCKAVFAREDGTTSSTYEGRTSYDRYEAEDSALSHCRDDNWSNRDRGRCRIDRCEQVEETTDSGSC